jgi:hypothetical protein
MNLAKAREDAEQAARVQASKRAKREATRAAAAAQAAAAKAARVREMQEQVCSGCTLSLVASTGLPRYAASVLLPQQLRRSAMPHGLGWPYYHDSPRGSQTAACLNDAPCPPFTSRGASIRQPFAPIRCSSPRGRRKTRSARRECSADRPRSRKKRPPRLQRRRRRRHRPARRRRSAHPPNQSVSRSRTPLHRRRRRVRQPPASAS